MTTDGITRDRDPAVPVRLVHAFPEVDADHDRPLFEPKTDVFDVLRPPNAAVPLTFSARLPAGEDRRPVVAILARPLVELRRAVEDLKRERVPFVGRPMLTAYRRREVLAHPTVTDARPFVALVEHRAARPPSRRVHRADLVDRVADEVVERARVVPGDVVEDALCDRRVQIVGEATMPNPLTV